MDVQQGGWAAEEDEARVRWALAEARALLARSSGVRDVLQGRMEAGTSFGDCVALVEERASL